MDHSRRTQIKNKVFTRSTILALGNIFRDSISAKDASLPGSQNSEMSFSFTTFDGTSFSTPDYQELGEEGGLLDQNAVRNLEFVSRRYDDFKRTLHIRFAITEGGSYNDFFSIEGTDKTEVELVFQKALSIINRAEDQGKIFLKPTFILPNLTALGLGSLIIWILMASLGVSQDTHQPTDLIAGPGREFIFQVTIGNLGRSIFLLFLSLVVGWTFSPNLMIAQWIRSGWPQIELAIGPSHLNQTSIKRLRIIAVWSFFILPLLKFIILDLYFTSSHGNRAWQVGLTRPIVVQAK